MLTSVANINEPLWRVKTTERSGCRWGYCFHGYKDVSFVAILGIHSKMNVGELAEWTGGFL